MDTKTKYQKQIQTKDGQTKMVPPFHKGFIRPNITRFKIVK